MGHTFPQETAKKLKITKTLPIQVAGAKHSESSQGSNQRIARIGELHDPGFLRNTRNDMGIRGNDFLLGILRKFDKFGIIIIISIRQETLWRKKKRRARCEGHDCGNYCTS